MSLPNVGMSFTPFDPLPASDLNDLVENIEALADWSAYDNNTLPKSLVGDGSGGGWGSDSWTPTFTGVSGGTLNYAKYKQIGKTVYYRIKYTMSGANVSGSPTFTTPTDLHADYDNQLITPLPGIAIFRDSSPAGSHTGYPVWDSPTTIGLRAINSAGSWASGLGVSSTVPFTWANNDGFYIDGYYEAP